MKKATSLFRSHKIECKESSIEGAGLGIFATEDIKAGELLEVCQYLIFGGQVDPKIPAYLHRDYRFWLDKNKSAYAVVLGWGSMFNSSIEKRNAVWLTPDLVSEVIPLKIDGKPLVIRRMPTGFFEFWTVKDIKAGEEIFTNYHGSSFKEPKESNI